MRAGRLQSRSAGLGLISIRLPRRRQRTHCCFTVLAHCGRVFTSTSTHSTRPAPWPTGCRRELRAYSRSRLQRRRSERFSRYSGACVKCDDRLCWAAHAALGFLSNSEAVLSLIDSFSSAAPDMIHQVSLRVGLHSWSTWQISSYGGVLGFYAETEGSITQR